MVVMCKVSHAGEEGRRGYQYIPIDEVIMWCRPKCEIQIILLSEQFQSMRDRLSRTSVEREVPPLSTVFEGDTIGIEVSASERQVLRCAVVTMTVVIVLFVQIDTCMNHFPKIRL